MIISNYVKLSRAEGQPALVRDVMAHAIPLFHLTPICWRIILVTTITWPSFRPPMSREETRPVQQSMRLRSRGRRLPASGRSLMAILFRSVLQNYIFFVWLVSERLPAVASRCGFRTVATRVFIYFSLLFVCIIIIICWRNLFDA
jgi:hypothetical protein